ncbi:hypothetical protein LX16_2018 [Stackebrandtia albiflava]|uniref:Uncharacterized protein n=1 Tax=Stackebrandtia albiflava TaxID=406432 RepID=A0A562VEI7_9ACTN|nr:hypothetical protein [Stackebrandtia albiflava]TWJ16290.1 hypothetical protein LX16_2018 [Stackebrandtia albiflava]
MTDPYRIDDPATSTGEAPRPRRGSALTTTLWILAAALAGTNTAMSVTGNELIGAFFGAAALVCVTVAIVRHVKARRS